MYKRFGFEGEIQRFCTNNQPVV